MDASTISIRPRPSTEISTRLASAEAESRAHEIAHTARIDFLMGFPPSGFIHHRDGAWQSADGSSGAMRRAAARVVASAVSAATAHRPRGVSRTLRTWALLAASGPFTTAGPLADDRELAGVDQLLDRRVVDGIRGDLAGLARTEMQLLAA